MNTESNRKILTKVLGQYGEFKDPDVIYYILNKIGKSIITKEYAESLIKPEDITYYTAKGEKLEDVKCARIKLIPIQFEKTVATYYCMFVASGAIWKGVAFGTERYFMKRFRVWDSPEYCTQEFLSTLYSSLLDKEVWYDKHNTTEPYIRLQLYILKLCEIALKVKDTDMVSTNTSGGQLLFNSGLIDVYGNDIFLIHTLIRKKTNSGLRCRLVNPKVVSHNKMLLETGFKIYRPEPLRLPIEKADLIFDGSIEDFDYSDTTRIEHLVVDRISRFPEELRSMPSHMLVEHIQSSIAYAVKRSRYDYTFIRPCYDPRGTKPSFLIPLSASGVFDKPVCALVIDKVDGKWSLRTVLSLEQAYISVRVISYLNTWVTNSIA